MCQCAPAGTHTECIHVKSNKSDVINWVVKLPGGGRERESGGEAVSSDDSAVVPLQSQSAHTLAHTHTYNSAVRLCCEGMAELR